VSNNKDAPKTEDKGALIGRKAGRLFKRSGPELKRLVEEHRPKIEKASRDAFEYAKQHEDEIRALAIKGVRMRAGPLGMMVDALGGQPQPSNDPPAEPVCPSCKTVNARVAKFCNQCGTRLVNQG
jgi:hypothetical protein